MAREAKLYNGWGVTGACFLCVAARRGSETAYGILLAALIQAFGWERASITGGSRCQCWLLAY